MSFFQIGKILGAHGLQGEVRVYLSTTHALQPPFNLFLDAAGHNYITLVQARPYKDNIVLHRYEGYTDRTRVDALKGQALFLPRHIFAPPQEDEFFIQDLLNLAVFAENGDKIGSVKSVDNYGGGDLVRVCLDSGGEEFYPFTKEYVPVVNIDQKRIDVAQARLKQILES